MKRTVIRFIAVMFLAFCVSAAFVTFVPADTDLPSKDVWEAATYSLGEGNTGIVIAEFDAVPVTGNPSVLIGYVDSSVEPTAFSQINAIIRFSDDGTIDARNGGAFSADATVTYEAGTTYKVKFVVDIPAGAYDVFVNGVQIADDYAFRTGSEAIDDLGKIIVLCFAPEDNDKFAVRNHRVYKGTDLPSNIDWAAATFSLGTGNTGKVIAEFNAVPLVGNSSVLIGYVDSSVEPNAFSQINAIIRFADDGTIDARNGGAFEADATVTYEPGMTYKVKFAIDIPAATYDVFVNGVQIADDYAFRTGSGAIDDLGKVIVLCFDEADNGLFVAQDHRVYKDTDLPSNADWTEAAYALGTGNSGLVTAEFDAVPLVGNPDVLIGYVDSSVEPNAFSQINAIIRFSEDGTIDARNGGAFEADATVTYEAGVTYKVKFVVNIPASTYDVFVNGVQIADDYAFRTGSGAIDDLGKIIVLCFDAANDGLFVVRSHTVTASAQEPAEEPSVPDSPKTSDGSILLLVLIGAGSGLAAVSVYKKRG